MAEILLTKGLVALIDDADVPLVSMRRWHTFKAAKSATFYARRNVSRGGRTVSIYMHRLIVGAGPDEDVDHRDGDGLNNRRSNLRCVATVQNMWNRRRKGRGVGWLEQAGKWRSYLDHKNRRLTLGLYGTEEEALAARAYAVAALRAGFTATEAPPGFDPLSLMPAARKLLASIRAVAGGA